MDISVVDVSYTADQSGEPRVNLGDVSSGKGFASGVPMWGAGDGFIGLPNAPDGGSTAPQALMATVGYNRFALGIRDPRIVVKLGQLAEGDRAVLSNCDAGLRLTKASNKIEFLALQQGMSLSLNASAQEIDATVGHTRTLVTTNGATMIYDDGAGIQSFVSAVGAGVTLSYTAGAQTCSITLGPGGTVAIVAPGGVTVNTIPLIVP